MAVARDRAHRSAVQRHLSTGLCDPSCPAFAGNDNSPLGEINIGLLADDVGVTTTNTLDLGQGVHDLPLSINVGVEETENVLELHVGFRNDEGHVESAGYRVH